MFQRVCPKLRQKLIQDCHTAGAMVFSAGSQSQMVPAPADLMVLVFTEAEESSQRSITYTMEDFRVQEIWTTMMDLTVELVNGEREEIIDGLLKGDVLYDPGGMVQRMRTQLKGFPSELKRKKMCVESSRLLHHHLQVKQYIKEDKQLDAFFYMLQSLRSWGRLAVIEAGQYPGSHLWDQVEEIHPGIFKLYRELVHGDEPVKQRMRLVLLAEEYDIMSRLKVYCAFLLKVLASKESSWDLDEIHDRLHSEQIDRDMTLVLEELVRQQIVDEVRTEDTEWVESRYRLREQPELK